jgi:uncharacterized surface protein with fasciclin (FAS1) repeats
MFGIRFFGSAVLSLALIVSLAGAREPARAGQLPTIAELALGNDDLESLVIAADRAGLVPTLLDPDAGPFTVFAPTDEAFATLLEETGIDVATVPVNALTDVLNDHILPGNFRASFLMKQGSQGNRLSTLGGLTLGFNRLPFQVNGIDIVVSEVLASNGIVFVIDQVLLEPAPSIADVAVANGEVLSTLVSAVVSTGLNETLEEDGPFTVFAPVNAAFEGVDVGSLSQDQIRDILLDHVVDGNYTGRELFQLWITRSTLVTKGGLQLKFRGSRVNGIGILATNISAGNGTIHLIDGILLDD